MRRSRRRGQEIDTSAWMNTYSDMVTLLLTFFVFLYSFSTIDSGKWEMLVEALTGNPISAEETELIDASVVRIQNFQKLYEQLEEYVEQNGLSSKIDMQKSDIEIQIRFVDNVLFDSGQARIKPEAIDILSKITLALNTYRDSIEMIRIEGHTDNVAIHTPEFPSNWELSTARAVEVLRFLVEREGFDANRISAVGYGEYHPIADNSTAEGRSKNRRVDFVISRVV